MGLFHCVGCSTCHFPLYLQYALYSLILFLRPFLLPTATPSSCPALSQSFSLLWSICCSSSACHSNFLLSKAKKLLLCWRTTSFPFSVASHQSAIQHLILLVFSSLHKLAAGKCPRLRAESCPMTMKLLMSLAEEGSRL